jgi:hypothetical protein
MTSNGISNAARGVVPEQARPTTLRGYAGWVLALLIAAGLLLGLAGTLYARLLPPVERVAAAGPAPEASQRTMMDPAPSLDLSACAPGQPTYPLCYNSALRRYEDARTQWQQDFTQHQTDESAASDRYDAEFAAWAKRIAAADRPLIKRLAERSQFWAGIGLLAAAAVAASSRKPVRIPDHRDPDGAAGAALRAESEAAPLAAVAAAAGATLLASLHSFTAFAIVGGVAAAVAWGAVSAAQTKTTAAQGYRIADAQWQEHALMAERSGQAPPPEPHISAEEAVRLGTTGGFVAPEGSAMAALLDHAGRPGPATAAWYRVAQAMGMGTVDGAGRFMPWAVLEHAAGFTDGDVELVFRLEDVTKTAADLTKVAGPLLREMRVKSLVGGGFTTRHEDGRIIGRFTNNGDAPAAAPVAAEVDDDWDF